jgi:hypothetical protein
MVSHPRRDLSAAFGKNVTRMNVDAWNLMSKNVEESLVCAAYVARTEQKGNL